MADGAGGGNSGGSKGFGRVLQRTFTRTTAKVLQNLGKADKTRDDEFEQHLHNFNEQQATATRLQKDLKHYISCVREMSLASQTMYKSIKETYEPNWTGYTNIVSSAEMLANMWEDYLAKLTDNLQSPMSAYNAHFPEMKTKIAKRGRKLTDYDSARHNHEAVSNSKKADEAKLNKVVEELNDAKHIYETINTELHEELPTLYQSRVAFLASYFNSLFTAEALFHRESATLKDSMAEVSGKLCDEAERMGTSASFTARSAKTERGMSVDSERNRRDYPSSPASPTSPSGSALNTSTGYVNVKNSNIQAAAERSSMSSSTYENPVPVSRPAAGGAGLRNGASATSPTEKNGRNNVSQDDDDDDDDDDEVRHGAGRFSSSQQKTPQVEAVYALERDHDSDGLYKVPTNNSVSEASAVPSGRILFKVVATHRYQGDDVDELSFEPGDVMDVIPFDDPEEQDEGWLMGIKQSTKEKGVFPENFTKRLE